MEREIKDIIKTNDSRQNTINAVFNPVTGEGSIGKRVRVDIPDHPIPTQWLPMSVANNPLVKMIAEHGSIAGFLTDVLHVEPTDSEMAKVVEALTRLRIKEDFPFWAAVFVKIKKKGGGDNVNFVLNRPQRRLISKFESFRTQGLPIRIILLKARQWGGSTATQMYMAWLQLVHMVGLNSLIVAQVSTTATEILDMFNTMLKEYPTALLHNMGEDYDDNEDKFCNVGQTNIKRVPQRNCKIKIGSAIVPDSARGGDYNLVHCSEVGVWKKTLGKSPEDIVRSATSGILYAPYTMIVYESTANGTGNFFHREYAMAERMEAKGEAHFHPLFVPWYEIDQYSIPFKDGVEREAFARWLWENRSNHNPDSDRGEAGIYYWKLWEMGATLEAIHWYCEERKKYDDHGDMASEFPSDSIEAFKHSGARVFDEYKVDKFRTACHEPKYIGDVYGDSAKGAKAMQNVRFTEDKQGQLWIWEKPEHMEDAKVTNRYLVVVDIGGRGNKADWSVICVFDRYWMMEGDKPEVVAQWYGHTDMDILAWKAAQIAKYYDNALLVIESNTLETKDREHILEGGDQSEFILNVIKDVYDNLYARKQSEADIREGLPRKYGFHTNVATKPLIISTLVEVVREHLYVERDMRCLDEFLTYERKQNGAYGAIDGKHDDLLMTRAIGLHICFKEMDIPRVVKTEQIKRKPKSAVSAATIT